jgi:hypothetical protein
VYNDCHLVSLGAPRYLRKFIVNSLIPEVATKTGESGERDKDQERLPMGTQLWLDKITECNLHSLMTIDNNNVLYTSKNYEKGF